MLRRTESELSAATRSFTPLPHRTSLHLRLSGGVAFAITLLIHGLAVRPALSAPPPADSLLPSGISSLDVVLRADRVLIERADEDGQSAHFLGDFTLRAGPEEAALLSADQAVVWIEPATSAGEPYQRVQVFAWKNARVREFGGSTISRPALLATYSTRGEVRIQSEEISRGRYVDTQASREAERVRELLKSRDVQPPDGLVPRVPLRVFDVSGVSRDEPSWKPQPIVRFKSPGTFAFTTTPDGRRVFVARGGTYVSRGVPGELESFELSADSAVVYTLGRTTPPTTGQPAETGLGGEPDPSVPLVGPSTDQRRRRANEDDQLMESPLGDMAIESIYLEGDVRMSQGAHVVRASRVYYDLIKDRALLLDGLIRTTIEGRNVPVVVRAEEIRQLSATDFSAKSATVTTSDYHSPSYNISADEIQLIDLVPSSAGQGTVASGEYTVRGARLNVGGAPILYWPYVRGNIAAGETSLRGLRTGYSDDFGIELETDWHLFNVLGYRTPDGVDATLNLDLYSERGPAGGVDIDYERNGYYGLVRSYVIQDNDTDFLGREREEGDQRDIRGRALLRHRQFLEDDWELTLEVSYLSDRGFLEEYFEPEFDNDKEQETVLRFKKQVDNWALTATGQAQINDFDTQTERLPDLGLFVVGERLPGGFTLYSENRAGVVRYRPGDQTFREFLRDGRLVSSGSVARADTRQEITYPLDIGDWRVVPFLTARATAWDDSPEDGGIQRLFGTIGVRASTYLWKLTENVRSELWDIDGIRHIIKPEFVAWASGSTHDANDLFPFDERVEEIEDSDGVLLAVRQRWQTKRGEGEFRRTVDLFSWDLTAGFFNDANSDEITNGYVSFSRPEDSIARNYVASAFSWRVNDRTAVLSELSYDTNDGEIDLFNLSVAVERPPRLSYLVGIRFIEETESNLLAFDLNYKLTEKYTFALREAFDIERGRTLDFTVALVRRFPTWFGAISFALDEAEDDFGVSISIWPEGLPSASLGSGRFTGLARSTGLSGF